MAYPKDPFAPANIEPVSRIQFTVTGTVSAQPCELLGIRVISATTTVDIVLSNAPTTATGGTVWQGSGLTAATDLTFPEPVFATDGIYATVTNAGAIEVRIR